LPTPKLPTEKQLQIEELLDQGFSSRFIAENIGVCKSTVNNYRPKEKSLRKTNGPKITFLDIETAATLGYFFGRFKINIGQENVLTEGGWILCASWITNDSDQVHSIFLTPEEIAKQDDSRIIAAMHDVYRESDIIVAHNSLGFDHKVIQTRSVFNNYPALPLVKVMDTLQMCKKHLKLPSNRLDSIGEYFDLGRKIKHSGISLWKEVQSGNPVAMKEMLEYCKGDTILLKRVYNKLKHLGDGGAGINHGLYYNDGLIHCKHCGSADVIATDRTINTPLSVFKEYACNSCGGVMRDRESLVDSNDRKTLLT